MILHKHRARDKSDIDVSLNKINDKIGDLKGDICKFKNHFDSIA